MAKIITISSFTGTGPYQLTVDSTTSVVSGWHLSDHIGKIYRIQSIDSATLLTIADDLEPDAPVGTPVIGSGSVYAPTSTYLNLSQSPFGTPGWDEIFRHDNRVIDATLFDKLGHQPGLEIWVDTATTLATDKQDGTFRQAYKTVQQALDVINADAPGKIWHIWVRNGDYSTETLTLNDNRRVLIEGAILGAASLGTMTWTTTGNGTTSLAFRNIKVGAITVNDGIAPATLSALIFENCFIGGITLTGASAITTVISGISNASFSLETPITSSIINGDIIGPTLVLYVTSTMFTPSSTTISCKSLHAHGSRFRQNIFIADNSVNSDISDSVFSSAKTVTFTGPAGILMLDTSSTTEFIGSGSTLINGQISISTQESTGWLSGGVITRTTGLGVHITAGTGYIVTGDNEVAYVSWDDTDLTLSPNSFGDIYVNSAGIVSSSTHPIDERTNVLLGSAYTDSSSVLVLSSQFTETNQVVPQLSQYTKEALGLINLSGMATSIHSPPSLKLAIDAGVFYSGFTRFTTNSAAPVTFTYWYRDGSGGWITLTSQTDINSAYWDDGTGSLAALAPGNWKKDSVRATQVGASTEFHVTFAQQIYSSQSEAEAGNLPLVPDALATLAIRCSGVVVQGGDAFITSITDERPHIGQFATGSTATTDHGLLSGLADDDHTQYLLVSGTRSMSGNLDMGTNNIVNVGLVDGTDVSTHGTRHQPGGVDAIPVGTPVSVGAVNSAGTATTLVRSDHVHSHGNLAGGTLHGNATTSVAGFMSSTDKTKLDGIEAGATATPLTSTAPEDVDKSVALVGISTEAARSDHKHDISTATASGINANSVNSEGSSFSLSRADHVHAIATGTVGAINVGDSASAGTSSNLARADHVHGLAAPSAPANIDKSAAAAGTATTVARADHKHDVNTAAAGSILVGAVAAEGIATTLARSDHTHALSAPSAPANIDKSAAAAGTATTVARSDHKHDINTSVAGSILVGDSASEGVATTLARSDHTHALSAPSAPANVDKSIASAGVATTVARSDHKHDISTASASSLNASTVNAEGTASTLARSDHAHSIPSAAAGTINVGDAAAVGLSTSFARADHVHAVTAPTAPANVDKSAAAAGTATTVARSDHKHDISTAVVGGILVGDSAAEGTATTLARSDHRHSLGAPSAPANVDKSAAAAGTATTVARSDHKHDISTAVPVAIGTTLAEGSSTSLSRADHVHTLPLGDAGMVPLPAILDPTASNGTRVTQVNFDGAMYHTPSRIRLDRIAFRVTAFTSPGTLKMLIYQGVNGGGGTASLIATGSAISGVGGNTNVEFTPSEGTVTLEAGMFYVLFGRDSGTGAITLRVYINSAQDLVNQNMLANTAPATFTTAIATSTTPSTFDPVASGVASTVNIAPIIRFRFV